MLLSLSLKLEITMHYIELFINLVLHLDTHIGAFFRTYGIWAYVILFVVIFCETGLVVTPFLPGDSLLFAIGALASRHMIDLKLMVLLLTIAAITGDQLNYWIGRNVGHLLIHAKDRWFFKKAYIQRTHNFYETYGGKTLILARFIPIIRTFAPFVAGLGMMKYPKFCFFSICGGAFWISSLIFAGFLFGNIPLIRQNFTAVVLGIIFVSLLPAIIGFIRHRFFCTSTAG